MITNKKVQYGLIRSNTVYIHILIWWFSVQLNFQRKNIWLEYNSNEPMKKKLLLDAFVSYSSSFYVPSYVQKQMTQPHMAH